MHDGRFKTLEEVIDFYDRGGDVVRAERSEKIRKLELSRAEKDALLAFLRALSEPPLKIEYPILPR
jgi:cytochrome c peroxidase